MARTSVRAFDAWGRAYDAGVGDYAHVPRRGAGNRHALKAATTLDRMSLKAKLDEIGKTT